MPSPVTECCTITLKPGVDLDTPGTTTAQAWSETLTTVSLQDGYQRAYRGRQLENPNIVLLLIDWDSLEAHQKFMNDPSYKPFVNRLLPLTEKLHLHHFTPSSFPPRVIGDAPVIEYATFYGAGSLFVGNVERFVEAVGKGGDVEGYEGGVFGEVIEDIAQDGGEEGKGRAVRLCIGWTSKEEHMKFRETKLFKDNIHLLREGSGRPEVFHVAFKAV